MEITSEIPLPSGEKLKRPIKEKLIRAAGAAVAAATLAGAGVGINAFTKDSNSEKRKAAIERVSPKMPNKPDQTPMATIPETSTSVAQAEQPKPTVNANVVRRTATTSNAPTRVVATSPNRTETAPATTQPETKPDFSGFKELPGYGKEVNQSNFEQLENSSVMIWSRPKGSNEAFSPDDGGNLVTANGVTHINTDVHQFEGAVSSDFKNQQDSSSYDIDPANIIDQVNREYVLSLQNQNPNQVGPIAKVTGIAVSRNPHFDQARLSVGNTTAAFNNLKPMLYQDGTPQPGEEVAVYSSRRVSAQNTNNFTSAVAETGIYLGRAAPNNKGIMLDFIGVPDSKGLGIGSSGVNADFASRLVSGSTYTVNDIRQGADIEHSQSQEVSERQTAINSLRIQDNDPNLTVSDNYVLAEQLVIDSSHLQVLDSVL